MRVLFLLSASLLCFYSNAQISITSAHMPAVGDTLEAFLDSLPAGFSIGPAGANRTWDFSNLQPDAAVTTYAVAPSSTSFSANFPNANLAITTDFSGYAYYRNNAQSFRVEGIAGNFPGFGQTIVNLNPPTDQYRFSIDYQDNFSGSYSWQVTKNYNDLPPDVQQQIDAQLSNCINPNASVQQVRLTFSANYTDTIDAWGKVITPIGAYDALRRKRTENSNTIFEVYTNCITIFTFQWLEVANNDSFTTEHSWLSTITKIPLISLGYTAQRAINAVTYSATAPPPVAGFTWSNPSGGLVNFTNTSQNAATYLWDFDNGNTSTQANPQQVYSANGDYYVCLTASNSSGSDTFCDTVRVTNVSAVNNAPVANRDSAQVAYPNSVSISPLDNDLDPNGDSIFYVAPFIPALNGTVTHLGNAQFEYEPNMGFTGIDSFQYVIRDNGSPQLRDTGTVVIRVDGPPFASFTYSKNGRTVTFQNFSTGATSYSWDLDDGTIETTTSVIHTYAADGNYEVCLTATNSFGSDDTCQTINVMAVGIEDVIRGIVAISPNPANGQVSITSGSWIATKVEVIDVNGMVLITQLSQQANQPIILDVNILHKGFYICKLTGIDGRVATGKLIKD